MAKQGEYLSDKNAGDLPSPKAAAAPPGSALGNPPAEGARFAAAAAIQAGADPAPGSDDHAKLGELRKRHLELVVKADEDNARVRDSAARRIALERNARAIGLPFDPDKDAPLYKGDAGLAAQLHKVHYEIADQERKLGLQQAPNAPAPPTNPPIPAGVR